MTSYITSDPMVGRPLRIAVHDFGGYAFPVELSRELARAGHVVRHFVCGDVFAGKAELRRLDGDAETLSFETVSASASTVRKYDPLRRLRWEWVYGGRLARRVDEFRPDVLLTANTPLIAQKRLFDNIGADVARVLWLQDLVSVAIERHVAQRSAALRALVGPLLHRLEIALARDADRVVTIAPQFTEFLVDGGVPAADVVEIRNWAPVAELPTGERMNPWRAANGFGDDFLAVYSGTLGLKHDPMALAQVAERLPEGGRVVVLAEGPGVEQLRRSAAHVPNLVLLPFVRYEELPDVLAAADVLVALLEPDASAFSVPSKVLTYLCAGRPVVASVPSDNLAATILAGESLGGVVVQPGDAEGLARAVASLRADPGRGALIGRSGRAYAEREFAADRIRRRFDEVLRQAIEVRTGGSSRTAAVFEVPVDHAPLPTAEIDLVR